MSQVEWRKYGVLLTTAKAISFDLFDVDGVDFSDSASFATGDVTVSLDGAAEVNATNLPVDEGQGYRIIITAAQLTASRIRISIVDQTATKVWLDKTIIIETFGNASAMFASDLDDLSTATALAIVDANVDKIPLSDGSVTWNATALASINAECDTAIGDYDGPTNAEMNARTLVAASYFDPTTDAVANVTLVATLTTYTGNTPQTADHTAGIADIPTVSEFNARTLASASYFDVSTDGVIVTTNNDKTGYSLSQAFPTNFSSQIITAGGAVDSLIQGYLNTLITETSAGRISGNFDVFYDNADAQTAQTVDDVGGGGGGGTDWSASERNEIRGRLGVTGTTAAGGNTPTLALEATVAGLNDLSAAQVNTECDTALTDYDGPTRTEATSDKDEIITDLDDIKGTGFVKDTHSLVDIEDYVDILDDGTSGNVKIATDVAATLNDTNELQTDDIPGLIAALNDLSSAQVNTEVDTALTDYDGPTNAEMEARTVASTDYFNPNTDAVQNVVLVATTTTNTDMVAEAPTAIQNRQEIDSNSTQLTAIALDTGTTLPAQINSFTIPKNQSYSNFPFLMVLTSDGRTPAAGLTVTGQRSIDGGSFGSVGGTIAEVSNGIYQFDALAADTNGDLIVWRFSAATADDTFERLQTI